MSGLGLCGGDRCRSSLRSWLTIEVSGIVLLETGLRGLAILVIRVVRALLVITHVAHAGVESALLVRQLPGGGRVGGGGSRFGFLDRGSGVAGGIVRVVRSLSRNIRIRGVRLLVALCLLTQESGLLAERAERLVWAVGRLLIHLTNLCLLLLSLLLGLLTLRLFTLSTDRAVKVVSPIELVLRLLDRKSVV